MKGYHQEAWDALDAAETALRQLEQDLRILSSGQPNAAVDCLANVSVKSGELRNQPINNIITSIMLANGEVVRLNARNDNLQNETLAKISWLYAVALADLCNDEPEAIENNGLRVAAAVRNSADPLLR